MYQQNQNSQNASTVNSSILVKNFFSCTTLLTVSISFAVLTFFLICQTVISAALQTEYNEIASLYYFANDNANGVMNAVVGVIVSVLFAFISISFFKLYFDNKKSNDKPQAKALKPLTASFVVFTVLSCIFLIIAYSSISVLNYKLNYKPWTDNHRHYFAAETNFFVFTLYGAFIIIFGIGIIRLLLAIARTADGKMPSKCGYALSLTGLFGCASLTSITFLLKLFSVVVYNHYTEFSPLNLLNSVVEVFVYAAATVAFIALSYAFIQYSYLYERIAPKRSNSYYASYSTNYNVNYARNNYPTQQQRPSMQFNSQHQAAENVPNGTDNQHPLQEAASSGEPVQNSKSEENEQTHSNEIPKSK